MSNYTTVVYKGGQMSTRFIVHPRNKHFMEPSKTRPRGNSADTGKRKTSVFEVFQLHKEPEELEEVKETSLSLPALPALPIKGGHSRPGSLEIKINIRQESNSLQHISSIRNKKHAALRGKISFQPEEMVVINELGSGDYASVSKIYYKPLDAFVARKVHQSLNRSWLSK